MKIRILLSCILTLTTLSASASQKFLEGDVKLACEAVMCLSTSTRPGECTPAINKFLAIQMSGVGALKATIDARKNFLKLCPSTNNDDAANIAANNTSGIPDDPEASDDSDNLLSKEEIQARITALRSLWAEQLIPSRAAQDAVYSCVEKNGRVQDGFCKQEMDAFNIARKAPSDTRDEIDRLIAQLNK